MLLINPRMTARRNARLPLSLLHLGAVLEGRWPWRILDGNFEDDVVEMALRCLREKPHALVGITVMPGPQVGPAIAISRAIRSAHPDVPIVWGGYFPTLYPDAALNAPYVDLLVRGQGEGTLVELLTRGTRDHAELATVRGLSWKRGPERVHNADSIAISPASLPELPYERLGNVPRFLPSSFLGRRTAVHQAAVGCRYRCEFCGVVSMWNGKTLLDAPERLHAAGMTLRDRYGADALQLVDHNFFDKEDSTGPLLDALAKVSLPWWCYARSDTLAEFSTNTWNLIRRSKLRMAYIGAEAGSDTALKSMKKGTRVEHTREAVRRCKEYGVIPELSFVLGGPEDPEGEIESTFKFIRELKTLHSEAEIILYFYSPTPQRQPVASMVLGERRNRLPVMNSYGPSGPSLPTTPEEWTEEKWVRWVCHEDAPWLSERMRQRIRSFTQVVACRFPTVQDTRATPMQKSVLRNLARWRYRTERYDRPWELELAQRFIRLKDPKVESL